GGHAWDAIQLVVNALKKVGPDKAKLRAEIEKTKGMVGISGVFNFSPQEHNGLGKNAFVFVTIKNGEWTLIK
ncbi:MAG: ABC transporter substrate-binding protein, partial [Armatimonadetes bacterium]|nr:ABC transporter substrate-binding protein [Armatimonadota bacterium]